MRYQLIAFSAVAAGLIATDARAGFVTPDGTSYPWVRGTTANSAYAGWESFTSRAGPNSPDAGSDFLGTVPAGALPFNLFDSGTTSTVLGSGNLYGGFGPLLITATTPGFGYGAGATTTFLLQVRTAGTEIDPASVNVNGVSPSSVTELSRVSLGAQGAMVETLWQFNLSGSPDSYSVYFNSAPQFMSLDAVAIDFYTVPTPGTFALLGVAVMASSRRRR